MQCLRNIQNFMINRIWYGSHPLSWVLSPLSYLYRVVVCARKFYLINFNQKKCSVPVIVVGNLTVGGVGKTPLVIALAEQFTLRGIKVGIVSRGYKARITNFPHEVLPTDAAADVGDEPFLLAKRTAVPVVIAPKRVDAVNYLLDHHQVDLIISDDGLQHYAMGRAIEIVVIDGTRGLGNQKCLPAGPLREPVNRLSTVDFVVVNTGEWPRAYAMRLVPGPLKTILGEQPTPIEALRSPIAAVAAIGNPQRFFDLLTDLQLCYRSYIFADHDRLSAEDFKILEQTVVMTEKDAVKCYEFATPLMYFLPVDAVLDDSFWHALWAHPHLKGYS
jgi:tetraacyldisaccharide 4'-kinase